MLFFQYFGGAVANCIAKTVFINSLGPAIEQYAPNVDPEKVIHAGATQVFRTIGSEDRAGVVLAYNKALTSTFVSTTSGLEVLVLIYFNSGCLLCSLAWLVSLAWDLAGTSLM